MGCAPGVLACARPSTNSARMRLALLISLTMIAFAANSVLNRLAVDSGAIDPSSLR